jgi:peptidyl-prolyl cis-trans isomerase D
MIKWFRSGIAVKAAGVVFAILMLVFVLTFVDWGHLGSSTSVGKVNGQSIDARMYQRQVQQAYEVRQRQSPQSHGLEADEAIRNQVWDEIINDRLLQAEYRRRHIRVSDDEVIEAIRTQPLPDFYRAPQFQTDSQFDLGKYQRWLGTQEARPLLPALEAQYREDLKRQKLLQSVISDVYPSDAALWERYRDEHETVKVDVAAIVPSRVVPDSAVSATAAEVEAYYQAHRQELERPQTIFTSYIAISRLPDASDSAAALARAEAVRKEIVGGAPFGEVAKRESADTVSAVKGGELGEWTRGAFEPAFDSVAFSLPLNAISQPVLTPFGYHLIQVTSRNGKKATGRHILIPIEVTGKHRDRLDAMADSLDRLAADRLDPAALDTVARALGLKVEPARPLPAGQRMQTGMLTVPDAGVWAVTAKPGQISPVFETPVALCLFRVDSIHPAGIPPLAQARDEVTQAVRNEKKKVQARQIGQELLKSLAGGGTLARAADAMKVPHEVFGPFTRITSPLRSTLVTGTAFGIDVGKHSGLVEAQGGYYVLQVLERTKADSAAFAKDLDKFRGQTLQEARQERVQTYLAGLRSTANIVDRRTQVLGERPEQRGS